MRNVDEIADVPRARIERATCGLGNRRSVQLSYRGVAQASIRSL